MPPGRLHLVPSLLGVTAPTDVLPQRTEFLTLRQSYERLRALADPMDGLVQRRLAGVAAQAQIYGIIQSAQDGVALLQDHLAGLAVGENPVRTGITSFGGAVLPGFVWLLTQAIGRTWGSWGGFRRSQMDP